MVLVCFLGFLCAVSLEVFCLLCEGMIVCLFVLLVFVWLVWVCLLFLSGPF